MSIYGEKELLRLGVSQLTELLHKKEISCVDITRAFLDQIEIWNPKLNAFITINQEAMNQAENLDRARLRGEKPGRLAGIPVAAKDQFCTKDLTTTAASRILHNFRPPYSATVIERLEKEGAVVIGKTNQDEFAMGSSNESSHYGPCRNPWDLDRVSGGSSGGSAAAVAALMAPIALGTDTGGSIRQPASFCGIVGVKPTYGRVSRYGIVAYASSLDQAGPMARTVADAALAMECFAGWDPRDSTSSEQPVPAWSKNLNPNLKGKKIGLPKEYFEGQIHPDVRKCVEQTIGWVKARGAETLEVSVPMVSAGISIYYLIATSEAASNLSRYDGVRYGYRSDFSKTPPVDLEEFYSRTRGEGFGPEVKRRIMLGTYALSSGHFDAYYVKACQVRRLLRDQFLNALTQCDVLLSPMTTSPAFKLGEKVADPLQMYLNDIFTISTNLAGLPGMSVPVGFSEEKLPIGVQLTAGSFDEQKMLDVGLAIEEAAGIKERIADVLQ